MRIDGMGRPPDPFDNVGLDDLPPKIEWLANETAKASNRGSAYDAVFAGASKGISVDQQRQAQTVQELEMKAQELAMKTAHLPRDEFNQLLVQLKQEGMREYDQPERQAYEMPNVGQSLAAIAGMIADPRNAANIAASPFQANMMKENQRFADSVQRYRDLNESRDRRYQVTKDALSIQDRADRDRQAQQQAVIDAELGGVMDRLKYERGVLGDITNHNQAVELLNLKGDQKEIEQALKTYNDPKTDLRNVNIAASFLRSQGRWVPDIDEASYVQRNKEAQTEGVKLDNKYKDLTLNDRVRTATANADYAELRKIGQEFNNDILEVRAKYADQKAQAEIKRLNGLADGANKAAANVSARPITSTSWFNAVSRYEGAADKNDALAKAYQAEADRYRGRAALIIGADPKEAEKMHKAAAALDAKAAIARANSDAAIETLNSLQEKFGGGIEKTSDPMGGGIELRGSIGQPPKPAPGKPTQQKKVQPKKGGNRINIVGIREKR